MKLTHRILSKLRQLARAPFGRGQNNWSEIEYFNPEWRQRIQEMAQHIEDDESVVDLGCGQMWLRDFLAPGNTYTGVDYRQRGEDTLVCDFNQGEFPDIHADTYFVSGCLEYVVDHEAFIGDISRHCRTCIISYCCVEDFANISLRRHRAWKNDLNRDQLVNVFEQFGMSLKTENKTDSKNSIFVFRRSR